ncbi:peptidoglycan-binding protein [Streptomyces sp. NPDC059071]|uniref:peptidoglycan-binding protein n=1 Tax=unclassified Streptomyces TaxID=2593676 RepID=UPI00365F9617
MARMPGATWRPVPNFTKNGQLEVRGLVVHVMDGTLAGTDSWFRNPASQASSHFGTGRAGTLYQWVSARDRAWAQGSGNKTWLSSENEGRGGQTLTEEQLDRNAEIFAWVVKTYPNVPLKVATGPDDRGLGYHAMGGKAWGGHTSCPGPKIVAQLDEIVRRTVAILGKKPTSGSGKPSTGGSTTTSTRYQVTINGLTYGYGATGGHITKVGQALVKADCSAYKSGPGPEWTDADTLSYARWQKKLGYTGTAADGVPGEESLKKLLGYLPAKAPSTPKYAPFPGAAFFSSGRRSPLITAMGRRLVAEGCSAYSVGPGDHWTEADRHSYAKWQRKLGFSGDDANGIPGPKSWAALKVPQPL